MYKELKENKKIIIVIIVLFVLILIGTSYFLFFKETKSTFQKLDSVAEMRRLSNTYIPKDCNDDNTFIFTCFFEEPLYTWQLKTKLFSSRINGYEIFLNDINILSVPVNPDFSVINSTADIIDELTINGNYIKVYGFTEQVFLNFLLKNRYYAFTITNSNKNVSISDFYISKKEELIKLIEEITNQ